MLQALRERYPEAHAFDLDGTGNHFVSEIEPAADHPEYDRAVEVISKSKPHKHIKTTQRYTVLEGSLKLYIDGEMVDLEEGNAFTVEPGVVHWAESDDECWVEIYSEPGWTSEDHISVEV